MTSASIVLSTSVAGLRLLSRGKVRDVYEVDENRLLLVATDRISAFDCILPTAIPGKGEILTRMSAFWFGKLAHIVPNHMITADFDEMPKAVRAHEELRGRSMLVKRTTVLPVECVVRGYLEGSGWKDYKATGKVCGHNIPPGLEQCAQLHNPIFTPATKAVSGHDDNIDQVGFMKIVGHDTAVELKRISKELYNAASVHALARGIIIADTKFEFGEDKDGNILLIDEALTPDSSRFWDAAAYEPGHAQPSFDKQFVREYLETLEWDKRPPAPALPAEIADATAARYREALERITGPEIGA